MTDETREPTLEEIDEYEICPTPPELALAICARIEKTACRGHYVPETFRILEPSAGSGAFVAAARATWPNADIMAVEIRSECEDALRAAGANYVYSHALEDFNTGEGAEHLRDFDLVLGNPPFSLAESHIRLLLAAMKPGAVLAFLLKMSFYESFDRVPFWTALPEDSFAPLVPRPGFKLNGKGKRGTDSQAYGLFTWVKGGNVDESTFVAGRRQREPHIVWREEQKKRPRGRPRKVRAGEPAEPKAKPATPVALSAPIADAEHGEQPHEGDTGPVDLE